MDELDITAGEVIDLLGGTAKTAVQCDVTKSAVSQWRRNGIPKPQLKYIKAVRPDIFQPPKRKTRRKPSP